MQKVNVIGAGMAGLLAGNMLRSRLGTIFEAAPQLPNNHSAVLRFRSSVVADTLNIPFRPVDVMKATVPWRNPVADALSYSRKVTGTATLRSSVSAEAKIERRWIAPDDLISRMAAGAVENAIQFGKKIESNSKGWFGEKAWFGEPIISTMPMPVLMDSLDYAKKPTFSWREGLNVSAVLPGVDAYASLYCPDPALPFSRVTLTGQILNMEIYNGWDADQAFSKCKELIELSTGLLGLPPAFGGFSAKKQTYAKILPIDDNERKRFIAFASDEYGIYSFGRFATWRPGLLLDDLVNDFRVIMKLIDGAARYEHKM